MINYTEIEDKYLKAFMKLSDRFSAMHWRNIVIEERELYDFFDGQGIHVNITPVGQNKFISGIHGEVSRGVSIIYPTRVEAETAAFLKAFEILEERLNAEQ